MLTRLSRAFRTYSPIPHRSAIVALAMAASALPAGAELGPLRVIGGFTDVEISVGDREFQLFAKVDTGADSTSIDARNIEEFTRDDEDWVRFEVPLGDDDERMQLEAEVISTVRIVGAGEGAVERPVVVMNLCVGEHARDIDVNLADREGMDYRLLIGREYLVEGNFIVNPAQRGQIRPACDQGEDE